MHKKDFLRTIVGRYNKYSEGYDLSNAGYVSVITLHTSIMDHRLSLPKIIDLSKIYAINAFDLAEATGPYMGQINMITVSSFSGPMGFIWGLDIALNDAPNEVNKNKTLLTVSDPNDDKNPISVFSASPLIEAAYALFGTEQKKHFPLLPGSHVPCVNSFYYSNNKDKYVFSAVGIGIAEDRTKNADLFMQYANSIKKNIDENAARIEIIKSLAESVMEVGINQKVKYKEIYVEVEIKKIPPNKCGCAFTAIPYILLARDAIPHQKVEKLLDISLFEWKELLEDKFLDH